jgi:UDP-glucose 4-epimerase
VTELLVTGATGLIGFRLVRAMAPLQSVMAVSRRPPVGDSAGVRWLAHDLAAGDLPDIPADVETVVHLAQSQNFREFPDEARDIFEVNVASTARLLDWAYRSGVRRFVYASSGGVYGHGDRAFREDDRIESLQDLGFYFATKQCAEELVASYERHFTVIVLRPFFVYGPEQKRTMFIPRLVECVASGIPITLQSKDGIQANPVHVDDAVRAIEAAVRLDESHRINIAGAEVLSVRQIAEIIGEALEVEPVFDVDPTARPRHLVGDIAKMRRLLREPEIPFAVGVRELCGAVSRERAG